MINAKSKILLFAMLGVIAFGLFIGTSITSRDIDESGSVMADGARETAAVPPSPPAVAIADGDVTTLDNNKIGENENEGTIVNELKHELTKDSQVTESQVDTAYALLDIVVSREKINGYETQLIGDQLFDAVNSDGDDFISSAEFVKMPQLIRQYELMQPPGTDLYLPGDIDALEDIKLQRRDVVSIIDRIFKIADKDDNNVLDDPRELMILAEELLPESINLIEFYEYSNLIEAEKSDFLLTEN